uniref:PAP-associated domain-containing protein n=1 Tax=Panagrolaimus sp. ES5 TaxID=591445 RepID=A0AC34G2F3_9BILA
MTKRTILIKAVVPILQITFKGFHNGIELEADININNIAGIYNTHLIHHYSRQDDRFPALCLLIKHWALNSGINSAQDGTFNSYSLILLVLHYMQCACQPPIVPNLQEVCPDTFNGQVPITDLRFFEDEYTFESENHSDFTALLMGFFAYYAGFDFDKYAISIRRNRVFPKQILPQETRKKYVVFIEEPFDHNNTARCVRPEGLDKIKKALNEGNRIWNFRKRPSLKKIGQFSQSERTYKINGYSKQEVEEEENHHQQQHLHNYHLHLLSSLRQVLQLYHLSFLQQAFHLLQVEFSFSIFLYKRRSTRSYRSRSD